MNGRNRLPITLLLTALLGGTGPACHQFAPVSEPTPSWTPAPTLAQPTIPPPPPVVPASFTPSPPPPRPDLPGGRVVWRKLPPQRATPRGVGAFLADVESHLPAEMGNRYRDRDRVTWCHETTHGIHAALRNGSGRPAFYPGGGRYALVEAPALTLGEVAAAVPQRFRASRYQLYLVSQRREWENAPLYVWDEWVAYNNGTTTGIEEQTRPTAGSSDDAVACIELSGYALAVAAAARRKGVPVSEQFREFLAWELRRSLDLYVRALALPAFAWPDRRLERLWRESDPFLVEELQALYGEALTVRDLLP